MKQILLAGSLSICLAFGSSNSNDGELRAQTTDSTSGVIEKSISGTESPITISGDYRCEGDKLIDVKNLILDKSTNFQINNSSTLTLIAERIEIREDVKFSALGIPGANGTDGADPSADDLLSHNDYIRISNDTRSLGCGYTPAGPCSKDYCGKPGTNGADGKSGGNIRLFLKDITLVPATLYLNAIGGKGGIGGKGKAGRRIGCNDNAHASERWACSGTAASGADGKPGMDGRIEIYVTGKNSEKFIDYINKISIPKPTVVKILSDKEWFTMVRKERDIK